MGWHYRLITYKDRSAFKFKEIPYNLKKLIVDKCLERNAGPYFIIPDMKDFLKAESVSVIEDIVEVKPELYDESTVFQFYSKSANSIRVHI